MLLYLKDMINANRLVISSVLLQRLETIFLSFSVGERNFVIGIVNRPPNSNNDDFMSKPSNILNNGITGFLNYIFYITGNFIYDLFSINSIKRCKEFYLISTSLEFFPNNNETN